MPRSENQKLKLLYLKELFETQSDEQHILSMQDIVSYLAARGIRAERKSVYGDISCLQEFGMDIVLQKGPGGGYFLASRPFELAELKLLAGAVQASKFLSERKSVALIEKLSTLCSSYQAAQLERQITVRDRVKSMNESIYYTVDRIHEAIAENKQIRFRYFDWGVDRRKHERPGEYFASPYALVWDNENYYLIAHSERHGLTHYRVDKMAKLSIADKPRVITEQARQLDLTRYGKTVFGMFSGTPQQVKLRFRNSLAGVVIDRFGKSAMLVPDGESHFTFTTEIVLSPVFYGWLAGFGEQAEIMFPASVREDFADLPRRIKPNNARQSAALPGVSSYLTFAISSAAGMTPSRFTCSIFPSSHRRAVSGSMGSRASTGRLYSSAISESLLLPKISTVLPQSGHLK